MDSAFVQRRYAFSDFDGIRVDGPFRVRILKSEGWDILVASSREDVQRIKVRKRNNLFEIRMEPAATQTSLSPVVVISMPELLSLHLSGSVQMEAGGFSSRSQLHVTMEPGAFLNLNGMEVSQAFFSLQGPCELYAFLSADLIEMKSEGRASVRIGGRSCDFDLHSAGRSRIDGTMLLVDNVNLDLSGISEIRITPDISMKVVSVDEAVIYYNSEYMDGEPEAEGKAILIKY